MRALVLFLLLTAAGCGMEPFDPPQPDSIEEGPGLFTGERGAFVLTVPRESSKAPADP